MSRNVNIEMETLGDIHTVDGGCISIIHQAQTPIREAATETSNHPGPGWAPPAAIIRTTGARGREAGYQGPSRGRGGGNELLILILCELGRPTKVRMDHLFRRRVSFVLAKKMDKRNT